MKVKLAGPVKHFLVDESGAFIIEFAITFPVLIMLSFGLLEFSLVIFDYQRAAEATRRGVRMTVIELPIADTGPLLGGDIIQCNAVNGVVGCVSSDPTTVAQPSTVADVNFANLLTEMQQAYPTLTEDNVILTYEGVNVGDPTGGGILPLVTLQLKGVRHEMIVGHLIGIKYINFPDFTTTVLGPGSYTNTVPPKK